METWRVEFTAGGKSLADVKIQRDIFQGDALSQILFIIAMIPLNHILRKYTARCRLRRSQKKINHLMCMDDIKLFAKNERELEILKQTLRIYSQCNGWNDKIVVLKKTTLQLYFKTFMEKNQFR